MKKTNHNDDELTDNLNNHNEEENPATEPKEESVNKKIEITEGEEKEVMEELVKGHIEDFKTTRIICKSGKLTENYLLERASLETCKSVIINQIIYL